jgi:hypothetical protein
MPLNVQLEMQDVRVYVPAVVLAIGVIPRRLLNVIVWRLQNVLEHVPTKKVLERLNVVVLSLVLP